MALLCPSYEGINTVSTVSTFFIKRMKKNDCLLRVTLQSRRNTEVWQQQSMVVYPTQRPK